MLTGSFNSLRRPYLALLGLLLAMPAVGGNRYARWDWYDPAALAFLQEAGITHVLVNEKVTSEFVAACEKAKIQVVRGTAPPGMELVSRGKWPGLEPMVQIGPGGEAATASATGEPWIDSNGWLILYHRTVTGRPVLLSYDPPKSARLRPGSVELGVAEAAVFGGHFAIKLDERFRQGLAAAQPRAVAEWKRVARQLEFGETPLFRGSPAGNIAVVVAAPGGAALKNAELESVGEVMNLLARRNLPFVVIPRKDASPAALENYAMVVAVGQPPLQVKAAPEGGAAKNAPIVVERKEVLDPSAFAAEVRKLLGERRLYHLTNSETIISYPLRLEDGRLALHLLNYAIDPVRDVRLRMAGKFSRVQLLAPERDAPLDLPLQGGEFAIPELRISAVVLLE